MWKHGRLAERLTRVKASGLRCCFPGAVSASTRHFSEHSGPHHDLIYPEAPTAQHCDLPSFLAHAERTGLDQSSTVYVGTHYEYTVAANLARYGFHLKRVGGVGDFGTDLLGTWTPPSTSQFIKILAQCKAGTQRIGPQHIRELEGAFAGAPAGWRGGGVLALLISERTATKGVRDAMGRSRWPMGFVSCAREGSVVQMLWNRRAHEEALEGFAVTTRHDDEGREDIRLQLNGKMLPLSEPSSAPA